MRLLYKLKKYWRIYRFLLLVGAIFGILTTLTGCELSEEDTQVISELLVDAYDSYAEQNDLPTIVDRSDPEFDHGSYSGMAWETVNDNIPYFTEDELKLEYGCFENYSLLDEYGRPGMAYACICANTMPPEGEKRGEIGMIKPAGWHTVKYNDRIEGNYLYNRCHLIGWQLGAENANELNLITGTRYLNISGMLDFENQIAQYLRENPENHVLYRVTPKYIQDNLLCEGLLLEARSIENDDICFCVFAYNVQPGVIIDYKTGESEADPAWQN